MSKKIFAAAVVAMAMTTAACSKTGENTYEVERPTVGTTTDTVRVPDVDVRRDTVNVVTPEIDVKKDTNAVVVPKVEVKKP